MAEEKNIKSRIIHKHDTAANWELAVNFIPKKGEIIIYDKDNNYNYERFKIGDGESLVNALPFQAPAIYNWNDEEDSYIIDKPVIKTDNNITTIGGLSETDSKIEIHNTYIPGSWDPDQGDIPPSGSADIKLLPKDGGAVLVNRLESAASVSQGGTPYLDFGKVTTLYGAYDLELQASDYLQLSAGGHVLNVAAGTFDDKTLITPELLPTPDWNATSGKDFIKNKPEIKRIDNLTTKIGNHGYIEIDAGSQVDHASRIDIIASHSEQSGEVSPGDSIITLQGDRIQLDAKNIMLGQVSMGTGGVAVENNQTVIYAPISPQSMDTYGPRLMYKQTEIWYDEETQQETYIPTLTSDQSLLINVPNGLWIDGPLVIRNREIYDTSFVPYYDAEYPDPDQVLTQNGWAPCLRLGNESGETGVVNAAFGDHSVDVLIRPGQWHDESHHDGSIYLQASSDGAIHLTGDTYINNRLVDVNKMIMPDYTAADEGKVLQIVNGVPTWVALSTTADIDNILKGGN